MKWDIGTVALAGGGAFIAYKVLTSAKSQPNPGDTKTPGGGTTTPTNKVQVPSNIAELSLNVAYAHGTPQPSPAGREQWINDMQTYVLPLSRTQWGWVADQAWGYHVRTGGYQSSDQFAAWVIYAANNLS